MVLDLSDNLVQVSDELDKATLPVQQKCDVLDKSALCVQQNDSKKIKHAQEFRSHYAVFVNSNTNRFKCEFYVRRQFNHEPTAEKYP